MKAKLLILIVVCLLLSGCSIIKCSEYLRQPKDNIERVELIYNQTGKEWTVLITLTEDQKADFLTKLSALTIGQHREPHGSLGYLVVGIYYSDDAVQMVGTQSSAYGYSENLEELEFDNWHYISYSELYELFLQYIDEEMLSSIE